MLLIEFRSFYEPVAIVFGAVLALFGTILALYLTGTTLNIVSFLGAIIGVGIVAKNGILMLDYVEHLRAEGVALDEAGDLSGAIEEFEKAVAKNPKFVPGILNLAQGMRDKGNLPAAVENYRKAREIQLAPTTSAPPQLNDAPVKQASAPAPASAPRT